MYIQTNLDSALKSRDITLLTIFRMVKAMVFPVVTYGCESWTVKKAEHQKIDAFKLWSWRRLLRVPWTARSNLKTRWTDAEIEAPVFWSSNANSQFIGKFPDAGEN